MEKTKRTVRIKFADKVGKMIHHHFHPLRQRLKIFTDGFHTEKVHFTHSAILSHHVPTSITVYF